MKKLLAILTLVVCVNSTVPEYTAKYLSKKEFNCLVDNIYYEARGESYLGKLAVGKVTMNRVDSPVYPKSICAVVYQYKQFSWVGHKPANAEVDDETKRAAIAVYFNKHQLSDFPATHYHNQKVKPKWGLTKIAKIGNHTFYKS